MTGDLVVSRQASEAALDERDAANLEAVFSALQRKNREQFQAGPRVEVMFFPTPPAVSCCDSSNDSALCDCGLGEELGKDAGEGVHPNQILMQRVEALRSEFGDRVDVGVASYASNDSVYAAIDQLNAALLASGKDFLVSPANFYTFIGTVAPIVTLGGRVAFVRRIPNCSELAASVERALVSA